jgi:hypothetical protein
MATNTYTRPYTPIKGRTLRVITLDTCGTPITGTGGGQVVITGFTQVSSAPQYEDGAEYLVKTADAQLCVNEKDASILKRFELTTNVCSVDPGMVAMVVSPARLLTYSEAPTGTGFALSEGTSVSHFSLEVWQRVAGSSACDPSGLQRYVYNAWPHLFDAKIGNYDIKPESSQLEFKANSKPVGSLWTAGASWLGSGAIAVVPDHWYQNLTTVAPPAATVGVQSYP